MAALQVGVVEAGVDLESKSIVDSVFSTSSSSFAFPQIRLTISLTQGIDKIISFICF